MKADPHPQQALRLATLRRYDILDTPQESDFDDIVELASQICGTPIAVVNLIDEHRQWFKAEVGLGTRETPLATSICSHVILGSEFLEISDTHEDPRTADNELCAPQDGLRFYAGALLKGQNGMPIGTLCVLDTKPKKLSAYQQKALKVLAAQVMRELELRLALRDLNVLRDEMDHRVKNSLASVGSAVRLYRRSVKPGDDPNEAFDAIARRIEAASALHEALHGSSGPNSVDLGEFVPRIIDLLCDSSPENITLICDMVPVRVAPAIASSVGVVVSEFVANAVKHAFPDGRKGTVRVSGKLLGDSEYSIICTDDGVGDGTASKNVSAVEGLGRRLVAASASQIGARLEHGPQAEGYRLELTVQIARVSRRP